MNLANWFPPPRMRTKREEIRNIILKLQEDQSKEKKKPDERREEKGEK